MARDPYNPPFPIGSPVQKFAYWCFWSILFTPWTLMFRWVPGTGPKTPREGPFLLVSNHTSAFDPVWIAFWIMRRASFMASGALFRLPALSFLLPLCGAFPKAKFVSDKASLMTLDGRYQAGDVIVLFPEGTRTFDGRTREVLPGIGRLVKRIGARVVCARVENGHLWHPRWARWPRWLPVRVSYDEPRTWSEDTPVEQINKEISEAIAIDPDAAQAGSLSFGFRLAEGLPDYLWACPVCFEPEGLQVTDEDKDSVRCTACGEHWTLDVQSRMNGDRPMRIHQAHDRITEHFGSPPVLDENRYKHDGVVLRGLCSLHKLMKGSDSEQLHDGVVELDATELRILQHDEVVWRRPLRELKAVSVEVQNRLTVRNEEHLLEIRPKTQSSLKWGHFLKLWVSRAA